MTTKASTTTTALPKTTAPKVSTSQATKIPSKTKRLHVHPFEHLRD
jgi:hypothetical protein